MKRALISWIGVLAFCGLSSETHAQTAGMLSFQGLLKDPGGVPINTPVSLTFRIHDAQTGGIQKGGPYGPVNVTPANGVVSTKFGPVLPSVFDGMPRWLEVSVNGSGLPRIEMATAVATAEQVNRPGTGLSEITISPNGNVGIGTTNTPAKLTVQGSEPLAIDERLLDLHAVNGQGTPYNLYANATINGPYREILLATGAADGQVARLALGVGDQRNLVINMDGSVGIGTTATPGRLTVHGNAPTATDERLLDLRAVNGQGTPFNLYVEATINGPFREILLTTGDASGQVARLALGTGDERRLVINGNGNVGIGTSDPQTKLDVDGTVRMKVAQITGADLAEKFPVTDHVKPGMVVAIDPANPGKLCLARGAYNKRVAGIVSGAGDLPAGAILGNLPGSEDHPPIAMTGRVWCRCDASSDPIEPGDRLTTSATPGHAMKVTNESRAPGAVIGKAMTALRSNQGLVLVLVQPQ